MPQATEDALVETETEGCMKTIERLIIILTCGSIAGMIACVWLREPHVPEVVGVTRAIDVGKFEVLPPGCGNWAFGKNWLTDRVSKIPGRWNMRHALETGYYIKETDPEDQTLFQIVMFWGRSNANFNRLIYARHAYATTNFSVTVMEYSQ